MKDEQTPPALRREMALKRLPWKRRPAEGWCKGVCAGLAKGFGWKPGRVRLAFVIGALLLPGLPILLYLVAAYTVPADSEADTR